MNIEDLKKYKYELPEELIRKTPLLKRDNAKLFVYDSKTQSVYHDHFYNLYKYLPDNAALILNNTTVKPVRLYCETEYGGHVEVFILLNEWNGVDDIPIMINKSWKENNNKILKVKSPNHQSLNIEVYKQDNKYFLKNIFKGNNKSNFINITLEQFLLMYGIMPIPHYLENKSENKNLKSLIDKNEFFKKRYNTVFAETGSSVAAPTASLHFTEEVFKHLKEKNINQYFITLDVGRGTFANLKQDNFNNKKLHTERYFINQTTQDILNNPVIIKIATGTTTCRAIETYGQYKGAIGITDIFITPGFEFQNTDILITNFHLPETSLMLLVDAFLQNKYKKNTKANAKAASNKSILDLYKIAIKEQYSFYSFGDSMLIL